MLEILLELVVQIIFSLGGEALINLLPERLTQPRAPGALTVALLYAVGGALCGALSLAIWPALFIPPGALRWVNLAATPLLAGIALAQFGRLRKDGRSYAERFEFGVAFALAMAAVRFGAGT